MAREFRRILSTFLALAAAAALAALIVSAVWTPEALAAGEPLRALGITLPACPGCWLCGMSRAFAAFTHAGIAEAVAFNGAVVWAYPLAWLAVIAAPLLAWRRGKRRGRWISARA